MNLQTKPWRPNRLLIFFSVLISLFFIAYACRKIDYNRYKIEKPDDPVAVAAKFFKTAANAPSYVKKIAEAIRHQNDTHEFVTKFSKEVGFPAWDKCPAQFPEAKPLTGKEEDGGGGGEPQDTLVFVPVQQNGEGQVVSFMGCLVGKDSVTIRLFRGDKYNGYKGTQNSFDELSPELVAMHCMVLDYLVTPGSDTFRINDLGLFKFSLWRSANASRFAYLDTNSHGGGGHGKGNSTNMLHEEGYIPCVNVSFNEFNEVMGYYPPPDDPEHELSSSYCVSPTNWTNYIHNANPVVLPTGGGGGGPWYEQNPCAQMPGGTCGNNGGGWTPVAYEDNPYNPYIADTIKYTERLKNTYPCVYSFIKDSLLGNNRGNVIAQLTGENVFGDSVYMHLTFDTSTIYTQPGQPSGETVSDSVRVDPFGFTNFYAKIRLNGWYIRNGTKEYMVCTIVHELMHACFRLRWGQYQQWLQWGPPNAIDSEWMKRNYPIYWRDFVVNGIPPGQETDHEIMAGDYVDMFKQIVNQFWNPASPQNIKDSVLKSMLFGGLDSTTAWANLPSKGNDTCDMRAIQVCAERSMTGSNYNCSPNCRTYGLEYADSLKLRPSCN